MEKIINLKQIGFSSQVIFDNLEISLFFNDLELQLGRFKYKQFKNNKIFHHLDLNVQVSIPTQENLFVFVQPNIINMNLKPSFIKIKKTMVYDMVSIQTQVGLLSMLVSSQSQNLIPKSINFSKNSIIEGKQNNVREELEDKTVRKNRNPQISYQNIKSMIFQ